MLHSMTIQYYWVYIYTHAIYNIMYIYNMMYNSTQYMYVYIYIYYVYVYISIVGNTYNMVGD